jgi:hypothetical protein
MNNNLVLVTSIIRPPNYPLSYGVRSIYTSEQRFEQTKFTIKTIQEKIPNSTIFIIECSDLNEDELSYFSNNSNIFLNLYNNIDLRKLMHSSSKSLCEGSMTICALQFLIENNIKCDNLIKISGRYYLSENFNYNNFNNNKVVIKYIDGNRNNVFTALYKIPYLYISKLKNFLEKNIFKMKNFIGYEVLFSDFIKENCEDENICNYSIIGLAGYVSVSNDFYNG